MTDLRQISFFLAIKSTFKNNLIELNQLQYKEKIIIKLGMHDYKA